ncbi:hypothetical protein PT2222_50299 [Paraburkholderia tropica]
MAAAGMPRQGSHAGRRAVRTAPERARVPQPAPTVVLRHLFIEKLLVFRRTVQRRGRRVALDRLRHGVEVARAHFALMLHGGEALLGRGELGLLEFHERAHVLTRIAVREVEHRVVQRVEACERDELELVAHRAQLALELGDRRVVEILLPVERRRAVVRKQLARKFLVDRFGELLGEREIRLARFAPDHVGIRRVGEAARDRLFEAVAGAEEAFHRAFAREERLVVVVDIRGDEVGGFGVGAGEQHGRHAADVGGQTRGRQLGDVFARRHEHLAAHMAALLDRGELIFEVHARGAGFDHRLHQFERVQHAAEARFGVRHDRLEEIGIAFVAGILAFRPLDLVGARERVVDALDHLRHRVGRVERLVWIHLAREVRVARDLPARQIDRLEAGLDLLHRLIAGERAQRVDERLGVHAFPELFRALLRERVLGLDRSAQAHHVVGRVVALDAFPARIRVPLLLELLGLLLTRRHGGLLLLT